MSTKPIIDTARFRDEYHIAKTESDKLTDLASIAEHKVTRIKYQMHSLKQQLQLNSYYDVSCHKALDTFSLVPIQPQWGALTTPEKNLYKKNMKQTISTTIKNHYLTLDPEKNIHRFHFKHIRYSGQDEGDLLFVLVLPNPPTFDLIHSYEIKLLIPYTIKNSVQIYSSIAKKITDASIQQVLSHTNYDVANYIQQMIPASSELPTPHNHTNGGKRTRKRKWAI